MMSRWKSATWIVLALLGSALLFAGARMIDLTGKNPQPNILVVSSCSLRADRLGVYNSKSFLTPKIDEWAKSAFVFTNAIAERPWENIEYEIREQIPRRTWGMLGYVGLPNRASGNQFYVPPVDRTDAGDWYWDEDAILHYREGLDELKGALVAQRIEPIYIFSHLKYMHYPYLDRVNWGPDVLARLSPRSRELLKKYLAAPENYRDKMPMIQAMLNSFSLAQKVYGVKDRVLSVAGIVSDPAASAKWRASADYADDLALLKELYDLKAQHFDQLAAEVLNLYGDRNLRDRTVVIFTGDHGEALMDHGVLGHSVNVYEEMIRYPLMIRFPGQTKGARIDGQVNHLLIAKLIAEIAAGRVTEKNFLSKVPSAQDVYSRNCSNSIQSIRRENKWKFIRNIASGTNELYDLESDPGETRNVIERFPDIAVKLEEQLLNNQHVFRRSTFVSRGAKTCLVSQ